MATSDSLIYFDKDILALIVTGVSVIVALVTVVITVVIGKKYMDQVGELEQMSGKFDGITRSYDEVRRLNETLLLRLELGLEISAKIVEKSALRDDLRRDLEKFTTDSVWLGRQVAAESRPELAAKISRKLSDIDRALEARRYELLCLANRDPLRLQFARYLAEAYGDKETNEFFGRFGKFYNGIERDEYAKLSGALEMRLSAPIDASRWTGDAD